MISNESFKDFLNKEFPNAKCALNFETPFQCIVAVSLSAQTTDKSVNKVTEFLFKKYPDAKTLNDAPIEDIQALIKSIGMYKNKSNNIKKLAKIVAEEWNNELILDFDKLVTLPGVGVKTANVVLAECMKRPAIAVDTHVARISKRLGFAKESDKPEEIEKKLEKRFDKEDWIPLHHKMIFFGRYLCHAQNPECKRCAFTSECSYFKKNSSKIFK